jgi:hypothetical protein
MWLHHKGRPMSWSSHKWISWNKNIKVTEGPLSCVRIISIEHLSPYINWWPNRIACSVPGSCDTNRANNQIKRRDQKDKEECMTSSWTDTSQHKDDETAKPWTTIRVPGKSRDDWTMHQHQVSMCRSHQPTHPPVLKDNHEQPTQGVEATEQSLVPVDCYRDHMPWQDSLHMLHSVGNNRDGMLSRGNQLYPHDISLFHLWRHGRVGTDQGCQACNSFPRTSRKWNYWEFRTDAKQSPRFEKVEQQPPVSFPVNMEK